VALAAKALALRLAIAALAVVNGALREAVLIPLLGRTPGLVLSGVLLCALILWIMVWPCPGCVPRRRWQLIGIGAAWFVLTLVFEFSLGRLQGKSWLMLLEAYTFKDGNAGRWSCWSRWQRRCSLCGGAAAARSVSGARYRRRCARAGSCWRTAAMRAGSTFAQTTPSPSSSRSASTSPQGSAIKL
jgi:hypothetical protein